MKIVGTPIFWAGLMAFCLVAAAIINPPRSLLDWAFYLSGLVVLVLFWLDYRKRREQVDSETSQSGSTDHNE